MTDVLCLGEILVDWISTEVGVELPEAKSFIKSPGGAPANTAVGLARQGVSTGFIGRISDDPFGHWLLTLLKEEGIDIHSVRIDAGAQTRMAYVVTTASGDRKLAAFSNISCADARLSKEDLIPWQIENATILHFGSISLIAEPAASATREAILLAREHNLMISYDPNIRIDLWPSHDQCKHTVLETLSWADLVKINEDELQFLTGSRDLSAADALRRTHNIPLLVITRDSRGAYITTEQGSKEVPGFMVKFIEATGAGDGFNAGMLAGLLPHLKGSTDCRKTLASLKLHQLADIVYHANAVGAIACTKAGAMQALPSSDEINAFLQHQHGKSIVH